MNQPLPWPGDDAVKDATTWIEHAANHHHIGGEWVPANMDDTFTIVNPSTGDQLAVVSAGDTHAVDAAVVRARAAFTSGPWPALTAADRAAMIWRFADLLMTNAARMATIETLNVGKPIRVTLRRDLPNVTRYLQYFAGWATKLHGKSIPISADAGHVVSLRQPVGVCAAIVPWNFPLSMAVWKLAPALAAGCTMILKPSEYTPFSALLLAELAAEAGIPDGVVNVVGGTGPRVGSHLALHPGIDKIAFTGSTRVGRKVLRSSSQSNLKKVSLELGGKSPHIIFADADLSTAIPAVVTGIMSNSGQNCVAGSRLLVEKSIYAAVEDAVAREVANVQVGMAIDPDTDMGPLISETHLNRVTSLVAKGLADGAELVCGAERLGGDLASGCFYEPTVMRTHANSTSLNQEEIFGPVLATQTFQNLADAVEIANDTNYGLAAGVWTGDPAKARAVAIQVRAGVVWVNTYGTFNPAVPFGGWKESGLGREGGEEALDLYTEIKSIWGAL